MTVLKPDQPKTVHKRARLRWFMAWVFLAISFGTAMPAGAADLLLMPSPALPGPMAVHMNFLDITPCGERYVAVGEYGLILYSDNKALACNWDINWQQARVPTAVTLTAVDFPTAQNGWAVGHEGVILHSADSGESWQIQASGLDANQKVLSQIQEQIDDLSGAMDAATDTATEEEKEAMSQRLESLELYHSDMRIPVRDNVPTTLLDVMFLDDQHGFVVGAFGMIMETQNGGKDWNPIVNRMNNLNGYHYYGIGRFMDNGAETLVVAGESGLLMRSTDKGQTWQKLDSPHEGTYFGVAVSKDAKTLLLYGLGGVVYVTSDLSKPWQQYAIPDNLTLSGAAPLGDGGFLLTSVSGKLFRIYTDSTAVSMIPDQAYGSIAAVELDKTEVLLAGIMGLKKIQVTDRKDD